MNILTVIILIFSVLGAIDYLTGNKLKIGEEFEKGFKLFGSMALSMIGMIIIAPWLAGAIAPVFDWVYRVFRIDPSVIPASLFANDMGGAPLAVEIAKNPAVGSFNALVVSSMMGATISFTVPLALQMVDKQHHRMLALGLLCGVATIPVGCFVAGLICRLPLLALLVDVLPLLVLAVVIGVGLLFFPDGCVKVFKLVGLLIKVLVIAGLMIGIVNFLFKKEIFMGMGTLEEGTMICMNASIVMTGMFPLLKLISMLLRKPLKALGNRLGLNEVGVMGFVSTLATNITTFGSMNEMNPKGIMLNSAFAVSAAFTFAGHLAFTMAFDSNYLLPVIVGKLTAGLLAVLLAGVLYTKSVK